MSDETKVRPKTVEEFTRELLDRRIQQVADGLRAAAERVEQNGARTGFIPRPGCPSYSTVASNVQHTVLWALANLGLDTLTRLAGDADEARLAGEIESVP